jgi:glycosyltransferase involved in cell wall biosynthesis
VLVVGPAPPAMGGIASAIEVACASGLEQRWELERFATSARRDRPRGRAGRALGSALARGLGFDAAFDLEARAQLRDFEAALATRPALVHLHCFHGWDFWLAARMARRSRRAGVPALLQLQGNYDVLWPSWSALRRAAFARALALPDRLIALSHGWKDWLARHADASRIDVVYNAVDTHRFELPARDPDPRELCLLFVGTRDPDIKGAHDLLAVAPELARALPSARLVFAGEDPERLEERCVRGTPLADFVRFVGRQQADAMPALYAAAHLLLFPSHREASPVALVEGMASGLPVVASRVGAIPEVLTAAGGALVEPGDRSGLARAILELARDPARRARCGAANRARARAEFDRAQLAARLDAIYRRCARYST